MLPFLIDFDFNYSSAYYFHSYYILHDSFLYFTPDCKFFYFFFFIQKRKTKVLDDDADSTDDVDTTRSVGYRVIQVQEIKMGSKLGTGAYGDVFKGKWHNSDVAVKVLKYTHDNFEAVEQEAIIMTKLGNHPNIIPFIGLAKDDGKIFLLTKLCMQGSLYDYFIKNKTKISEMDFSKIILQMCYGLDYLHLNQVIHRDVAARNYLMDTGQRVFISDFGMSRLVVSMDAVQSTKTQEGPIRWMAPESLGETKYSVKSDIYICLELLYGSC